MIDIMQDDPFPAAERILADIETVFKKDPELREFDIIPVTLNQNKSPVHHVEHCLGLESWCVRHVYCYAYHRLMDARQQRHRRTDPSAISRMLLVLLLNPDVQTFWNMRRELVQAGRLDVASELHFTSVVLSKKPKSAEAFAHRKWLLGITMKSNPDVRAVLNDELKVTQYAADRHANNYHAWLHRMWCLTHLAPAITHVFELYVNEWSASEAWISMHVSDHSGLQYRQFLLKQMCDLYARVYNKTSVTAILEAAQKSLEQYLLPFQNARFNNKQDGLVNSGEASKEVFEHSSIELSSNDCHTHINQCSTSSVVVLLGLVISELILNADLIVRYTGHEALWYHRRFSLSLLQSLLENVDINVWKKGIHRKVHQTQSDKNHCDRVGNDSSFFVQCCDSVSKKEVECTKSYVRSDRCSSETVFNHKRAQNCLIEEYPINHVFDCVQRNCDATPLQHEQKLVSNRISGEDVEICCLISKCIPSHEEHLLQKCGAQDSNQQRLSAQHRHWLTTILELPLVKPK